MIDDIKLTSARLHEATVLFVQAATALRSSDLRHTQAYFPSLSSIDEDVRSFFYTLWVGRAALADAARSAALTVSQLSEEAELLDQLIASQLGDHYLTPHS